MTHSSHSKAETSVLLTHSAISPGESYRLAGEHGASRCHHVIHNEGPVIIHSETGRITQVHDY
jgi:hypothetical protein